MKTTKRIIVLAITTFYFSSVCYSQRHQFTTDEALNIEKDDIKNAPYIFEGTIIKQYTNDSTDIVCSVIKIIKIYRGNPQLKLGTIKIINEQSRNTRDGDPMLNKGDRYIILGKLNNFHLFDTIATDNRITLALADLQIGFSGQRAIWGQTVFKTKDSLYSFFKENGLTVQEEQK